VHFLTLPEIEAILAAPDRTTWLGRRDHILLLLAAPDRLAAIRADRLGQGKPSISAPVRARIGMNGGDRKARPRRVFMDADKADDFRKRRRAWEATRRRLQREASDAVRSLKDDDQREATIADAIRAIRRWSAETNSHERLAVVLELLDAPSVPAAVFWPVLLSEWSSCDVTPATWLGTERLLDLLRRHHAAPWVAYVEPDTGFPNNDPRPFWAALPDILTVYRGCSRSRVAEIAWTTDRKVAEGFAHGHRFIRTPDPVMAIARIAKLHVFAAFVDRGESGVLLDPDQLTDVTVADYIENAGL
jgi:hypothetical protein